MEVVDSVGRGPVENGDRAPALEEIGDDGEKGAAHPLGWAAFVDLPEPPTSGVLDQVEVLDERPGFGVRR